MSDLNSLLTKRAELNKALEALEAAAADNDEGLMTDEQREEYDAKLDQLKIVTKDAERVSARIEEEKASFRRERDAGVTTAGHWVGQAPDDEQLAQFTPAAPAALPYVAPEFGAAAEEDRHALRMAYQFGAQLLDVKNAQKGLGTSDALRQIQAAATGAGENVGADGGFLVQTDVGAFIGQQIVTGSEVLSRARRIPLGANSNGISLPAFDETSRATGSRFGGVQGYWIDEGTAITASRPAFRKIEYKLNKLACLGYATDELAMDVMAFGSIMLGAFVDEVRWLVEDAFINGTGAGQPLGILTAPALVSVTRATASEVNQADISGIWARMLPRSKGRSVFYINTDVNPELDTMFVAGASSDLPPRFITYDQQGTTRIKGRTLAEIEYCATMGTVGDVILADMSLYGYIDKAMQSASSMHVQFTQDEMTHRVVYRVDGRPMLNSAITPANGTNTLSPFVAIAT